MKPTPGEHLPLLARTTPMRIPLLAVLLLTTLATAQQPKPYTFPAYDEVKGLSRRVERADYDSALADKRFTFTKITYPSDRLEVTAYLYRPAKPEGKLPLIIYNRGGYITPDMAPELLPQFNRFAQVGFAVIAPMYRQSEGAGGIDQVGGDDLNDLLNLKPVIAGLDYVDQQNIFLVGESRGGMMTYQALREGFPVRAAAVYGAFTDFRQLIESQPQVYEPLTKQIFPDYAQNGAAIDRRRSAALWAEQINTPILIMHGGEDSLSPAHSLRMAGELQKHGKTYQLMIFAGEKHSLSRDPQRRDAAITEWLKRFSVQAK